MAWKTEKILELKEKRIKTLMAKIEAMTTATWPLLHIAEELLRDTADKHEKKMMATARALLEVNSKG